MRFKLAISCVVLILLTVAMFHFFARSRRSEFYLHHSGFGVVMVNLLAAGAPVSNIPITFTDSPHRLADIPAGRNAVYIEFPVEHATPEQTGAFICLGFVHPDPSRRKRVDLFVSPGADAKHIHARLTADGAQVLFDGDVALFDDSVEEPFVLSTS